MQRDAQMVRMVLDETGIDFEWSDDGQRWRWFYDFSWDQLDRHGMTEAVETLSEKSWSTKRLIAEFVGVCERRWRAAA